MSGRGSAGMTPSRVARALRNRLRRVLKAGWHRIDGSGGRLPEIVFIFGCQRSGTTMLLDVFERDLASCVYRDVGRLTTEDTETSIRLNRLESVEAEFRRSRARFVVAKPIVESQRAREILERFASAQALWIYRDFRSVAASDLRLFGADNGIRNLMPMLAREPRNWRSEGVSDRVHALIDRFFDPQMNPRDAAALFWYARNELYFEQELESHPRVLLLRYEDFVRDPVAPLGEVYSRLGRQLPGPRLWADVHTGSVSKGRELALSPEVLGLCEELMTRLSAHDRFREDR